MAMTRSHDRVTWLQTRNIFISGGGSIKIGDFGLARDLVVTPSPVKAELQFNWENITCELPTESESAAERMGGQLLIRWYQPLLSHAICSCGVVYQCLFKECGWIYNHRCSPVSWCSPSPSPTFGKLVPSVIVYCLLQMGRWLRMRKCREASGPVSTHLQSNNRSESTITR